MKNWLRRQAYQWLMKDMVWRMRHRGQFTFSKINTVLKAFDLPVVTHYEKTRAGELVHTKMPDQTYGEIVKVN